MVKYVVGLVFGISIVACSVPQEEISLNMEISTATGCPVAQLILHNHSGSTVYLDMEAPQLSIVDELGGTARYTFSPGYFSADDINNYIALGTDSTHIYVVKLALDYELKLGSTYTVTAGGKFTDPITHKHVVISEDQKKFRYVSSCRSR